jgi:hypothetical protein
MKQAMGRQWTLNRTSSKIGDESIKGIRQALDRQWTLYRTGSRIGDESQMGRAVDKQDRQQNRRRIPKENGTGSGHKTGQAAE